MKTRATLLLLIILSAATAECRRAEARTPKEQVPPKKPAGAASPNKAGAPPRGKPGKPKPEAKLLWESWYTIEADGSVPYGYYSDRAEKMPDGRLHFENRIWKHEEGWINEESLGAYAKDDPQLTPLFFNFWSNYRSTETLIDGTITDGKQLAVRIKKTGKELPVVKRSIPVGTTLSVFFPLWIGRAAAEAIRTGARTGAVKTFLTVFEDDIQDGFPPKSGNYRLEEPDEFAMKTGTTRLRVETRDLPSHWYITKTGMPIRIDMPASRIRVNKVASREEAEGFLKKLPPAALEALDDAPELER